MKWMLKRLNEPSTWAGLAIVAGAGQVVAADPKNPAAWLGALAGLAAAVKSEKGAV
jgi:hypothetical protein